MIVPKAIAGYTGFRWPTQTSVASQKTYVEGAVDKVWLPSTTELNIMAVEDNYTNPSDEASSTAFEYFKNYTHYKDPLTNTTNTTIANALKTERTDFVRENSFAMNYSIPLYQYNSTAINDDISTSLNSTNYYWTRSPRSYYCHNVRYVGSSGSFDSTGTNDSNIGVRPCIILKY